MSETFADVSLEAAFDRAVLAATHLEAHHAATVKAARLLARKIDAWDMIVRWAIEDADGEGRPAVPQNDNVSLASFLKYMNELRLVPTPVAPVKVAPGEAVKSAAVPEPADEIAAMRERLKQG